MTSIVCNDIFIQVPGQANVLIEKSKLVLNSGRRYGLIGNNGSGKSTLLKHISNGDLPDFPKQLKMYLLQQDDHLFTKQRVVDFVIKSDNEVFELKKEIDRLTQIVECECECECEKCVNSNPHQSISQIETLNILENKLNKLQREAKPKATATLNGLQFTKNMQHQSISELSGGWKQKVALACALQTESDILLLDEPTNHLDFDATLFLIDHLKSKTNILIVVSHDHLFLNSIATDIVCINSKQLHQHKGNFDDFDKIWKNEINKQQREYDLQQKQIQTLKSFVSQSKKSNNLSVVQSGKSKQILLNKLQTTQAIKPVMSVKSLKFVFPHIDKLDHALLNMNNVSFSYPGVETPVLKNINLSLQNCENKIGLVAPNGCGKTTLVKLITKVLIPTLGDCKINSQMRFAVFDQNSANILDLNKTTLDFMQSQFPQAKEHEIRGIMGQFGFNSALIKQTIKTLSGGQKSRIVFAVLTWTKPHLIILDEPTNHLDMDTINSLIEALNCFSASVIAISHDTYFLDQVATEFWAISRRRKTIELFYNLNEAKEYSYD